MCHRGARTSCAPETRRVEPGSGVKILVTPVGDRLSPPQHRNIISTTYLAHFVLQCAIQCQSLDCLRTEEPRPLRLVRVSAFAVRVTILIGGCTAPDLQPAVVVVICREVQGQLAVK